MGDIVGLWLDTVEDSSVALASPEIEQLLVRRFERIGDLPRYL